MLLGKAANLLPKRKQMIYTHLVRRLARAQFADDTAPVRKRYKLTCPPQLYSSPRNFCAMATGLFPGAPPLFPRALRLFPRAPVVKYEGFWLKSGQLLTKKIRFL